ncbi:methionine sulfoxide reductase A [Erysipelothrix larvae]|uniref:Peptide methionine sulfoxide reductase MsrA n=1 Tax=Erysipelothrix larvae TaxID=1514105 RepID=A0A120JTG1_9FIRM|nr:peptide-methionine (S)-S-oxide reductase MsrA [Erysipelothrix larvae]AMC92760.1 methionine sulfoxide reductase A [Erysipelothrix larvae]
MTSTNTKTIVVAGGCYWGVEEYFRRLKGIIDTKAGFAQGTVENPTYEEVCTGQTDHAEAVVLTYDPSILSLSDIADHIFRIIDPTSLNKQGGDIGTQYRTGLYPSNTEDLKVLQDFVDSKRASYNKPVVVEVEMLRNFYDAPTDHQLYLVKNPHGYCHVDFSKLKPEELK